MNPQEAGKAGPPAAALPAGKDPILVHVLFMDIVGSSRLASDDQEAISARLTHLVRGTKEFQEAHERGELISLPTGDGMALVFLNRVQAPLLCAVEIARGLCADPFCQLRMGINSGLVLLTEDINGKPNVSGSGINIAERVMSCGGASKILVSGSSAEALRSLAAWRDKLTYLGEYRAKKDWVHLWNFQDGEIGCTAPIRAPARRGWKRWGIAAALLAVLAIAAVVYFNSRPEPGPAAAGERTLRYSVMVQQPDGAMQELLPGGTPPSGASLKLNFSGTEDGFLYVVAEGPATSAGPSWFWLFPEPHYQMGSGQLLANRPLAVPTPEDAFVELDPEPGDDVVHVIWSQTPIQAMDRIKTAVFERMKDGRLLAAEVESLQELIRQASPPEPQQTDGGAVVVNTTGSTLITEFRLSHM